VANKTTKAAAAARIGTRLAERKRDALLGRLRPCFTRIEPFTQVRKYVRAVMSDLPTRNGWTIAEYAGDASPDKTQRLLNRASWDAFEAMSEVRKFAVAGIGEAARRGGRRRGRLTAGALDETGQEKKGDCSGSPREHVDDVAASLKMALPPALKFRTKGELAIDILAEVHADGVIFDFVCGDEVYGNCTELRNCGTGWRPGSRRMCCGCRGISASPSATVLS
jgi:hypothetical protein